MDDASGLIRLECGVLDLDQGVVRREDGIVELTPIECDLLAYLARTPGSVVTREVLLEQVWGYAPSSTSKAVHVAIRRLRKKIELDPSEPTHLKTVPTVGWLLELATPAPSDGLVGREELLATLATRIRPGGLWTLLGPGGIGKTRLARELIDRHGGTLADLSTCSSAEDVVVEVARALDCPPRAVGRALAARTEMVILDNVEHIVEVVQQLVGPWVGGAPLVMTSRVRVGLVDEHVVVVPALEPEPAAALYVRRARAAGSDGEFDPEAVRSLCIALEGNPLCIELAASRARLMDPATLQARLTDRFAVLRSRDADRPDRHVALEAAIDWSWQLLDAEARSALSALCCFRGGFPLDAAEAVIGPGGLDRVQELLDASLCFSEDGRLDLYVSVREFVLDRQPPDAGALDRHSSWCADLVHDADPASAPTVQVMAARAREVGNLVAAARRELESGGPRLVELAIGLGLLARAITIPEAETFLRAAVDRAEPIPKARLLRLLASIKIGAGALSEALALLDESVQATDDPLQRGSSAEGRASVLTRMGRFDEAEATLDEAERCYTEVGHPGRLGAVWTARGALEHRRSRLSEAERAYRRSIALYRQCGERRSEAVPLGNLTGVLLDLGRPAEARRCVEEAIEVFEQSRDDMSASLMWCNLGRMLAAEGDLDAAEHAADRAAELASSDARRIAATRALQGMIAAERGHFEEARELGLAAIRAAEQVGNVRTAGAYRVYLARMMREEGDRAGAAACVDKAIRQLDGIDVHLLIMALCERNGPGDLERARSLLDSGGFGEESEPALAVRRIEQG